MVICDEIKVGVISSDSIASKFGNIRYQKVCFKFRILFCLLNL